jgi:hypothetical protein
MEYIMSDQIAGSSLSEEEFHFYFPVFTVANAGASGVNQNVFSPTEACEIQTLMSEKRGRVLFLFTDEDLAQQGAASISAIVNLPYCCVVRIDRPEHLINILRCYQSHGVTYVGTDNHFGPPRAYGFYRTVEELIRACENAEYIPEDSD